MKYFRHYRAKIQPTKIEDGTGNAYEVCALYMGKGREPHIYTRIKLPMKAIIKGRRATLPWRRVWLTK